MCLQPGRDRIGRTAGVFGGIVGQVAGGVDSCFGVLGVAAAGYDGEAAVNRSP